MNNLIETYPGHLWSRIFDNALTDNGVIVDVGCLNWDWGQTLVGHKRIIGVDPIEKNKPDGCELFNGVLGASNGKVFMDVNVNTDASNIMNNKNIESESESIIEIEMLDWKSFCKKFEIESISVLKLNIEGSEYPLLNSMDSEDFSKINQIAVSFHDWMNPRWNNLTKSSLQLLRDSGFDVIRIYETYGWYLAFRPQM
jgi:FkbM family methyltransferase